MKSFFQRSICEKLLKKELKSKKIRARHQGRAGRMLRRAGRLLGRAGRLLGRAARHRGRSARLRAHNDLQASNVVPAHPEHPGPSKRREREVFCRNGGVWVLSHGRRQHRVPPPLRRLLSLPRSCSSGRPSLQKSVSFLPSWVATSRRPRRPNPRSLRRYRT